MVVLFYDQRGLWNFCVLVFALEASNRHNALSDLALRGRMLITTSLDLLPGRIGFVAAFFVKAICGIIEID